VEVRDIDLEEKRVEKERYAVLVSDAIIDIGSIPTSDIKEYYELVDKINNIISKNYGFKIVHGEIEYRSLGWDLYSDRPKPFYFFLKAGSLIKINYKKQNEKENKQQNVCNLIKIDSKKFGGPKEWKYLYVGKVGELKEIGAGTFVLLNLDNDNR